jgi:hypothetical protein
MTGLACLYSCCYRSKLRAQYDLPEAPCMDCLVHFCCETCTLCQEYRELKNRGYDLSIGTLFFLQILPYAEIRLVSIKQCLRLEMRKHGWKERFYVEFKCKWLNLTLSVVSKMLDL